MKPTPLLLLVALAWASFGFAEQAPQPPSPANAWQQSQNTDAVRGITYTRYTLAGRFLPAPQNGDSKRPTLVVDCIPGKGSHDAKGKLLEGSLLVGTTLKIVYVEPEEIHGMSYYPKIAVRFRTDDSREEDEKWSPGTEKTSVSIRKHSLKKIVHAHTVGITADDDSGSPVAMQFEMPDATPVEQACNLN